MDTGYKSGERGSALERAIVVLEQLARSDRPIGLAELSEEIELPKATLHRILQQLSDIGFILRAPEKDRYVLGPNMLRLSALAMASLNVRPPLRAILDQLVSETGETCNVGILDQDQILYIERVEGTLPLRLQLQVGSHVPIHCTAMGKLLVAEQHKNVRTRIMTARKLEGFTANTLTDPRALEAEFTKIRSQEYSFNNEEYMEGLTAVAVAIRDRQKKVVASLAIHAPSVRMDLDKALSYLPSLHEKARRIAETWNISSQSIKSPLATPVTKSKQRAKVN